MWRSTGLTFRPFSLYCIHFWFLTLHIYVDATQVFFLCWILRILKLSYSNCTYLNAKILHLCYIPYSIRQDIIVKLENNINTPIDSSKNLVLIKETKLRFKPPDFKCVWWAFATLKFFYSDMITSDSFWKKCILKMYSFRKLFEVILSTRDKWKKEKTARMGQNQQMVWNQSEIIAIKTAVSEHFGRNYIE